MERTRKIIHQKSGNMVFRFNETQAERPCSVSVS
jgi:hypothetical protein